MDKDNVVVPPGHKVVIAYPTPTPEFRQTASSVWILNFGDCRFVQAMLDTASEFVSRDEEASVIWILAGDVLETLDDPAAFLESAATLVRGSSGKVSHIAIFPDDTPSRAQFMRAFRERRFGVHFGGPERECFVEVHKPDGSIVVGMAGPAFTGAGDGHEPTGSGSD